MDAEEKLDWRAEAKVEARLRREVEARVERERLEARLSRPPDW